MGKIRLYNQDCLKFLEDCGHYDCIFLDPPDNTRVKYQGFEDYRSDYYEWLEKILLLAITKSKVTWLSYNAIHDLKIKATLAEILKSNYLTRNVKMLIWRYTFGQYNDKDCANGYRPLLRIARVDWKPDVSKIKILSKRMKIGDSRAKGLRVPDDVWEFSRIVGNSPERRAWSPCQHPEALLRRIFLMSSGSRFLDCFCGSGTGIRVAKQLKLDLDSVEISKVTCDHLMEEHNEITYIK